MVGMAYTEIAVNPITIRRLDVPIKAVIPYKVTDMEWDPEHTIVQIQLGDEFWILDVTGRQYGFPEFLLPLHTYERTKVSGGVISNEYYKGDYDIYDETGDSPAEGSPSLHRLRRDTLQ